MPIYEYACNCGNRFEKLVRRFGEPVSCPTCLSPDVEKQLSVFAVATSAPTPASSGCGAGACGAGGRDRGSCDGGPCSFN
jgi:putative FmdB family regulatory protein